MNILTYTKNNARTKLIQASILITLTTSPIAYKVIVPKYDTKLANTTSIYADTHSMLDEILESNRRYTRRGPLNRRINNSLIYINRRTNTMRRNSARRNIR